MALDLAFDSIGDGPPLVILHGLFGSRTNWRSIARAMSATHRVISVDLRNHGGSPWSDTMGYPEMADDVRELMAREKLQEAAVMGHSMGGKTAMSLALLHPGEVGRLIVVDIAPVDYADRMSEFAQAMRSVDLLGAAGRNDVGRRLRSLVPDPGVVPFLLQNLVTHDEHFDWRINLSGICASMDSISGFAAPLRRLRYEGPVHVIVGGRSDYVADRGGAEFQPMFPRAAIEVVEQAGHWIHADQQAAFLARIRRVLGGGSDSPPRPAPAERSDVGSAP